MGIYQAREKFDTLKSKKNFNTWLYYESWNTYAEANSLIDIERCLKNFDKNKNIIIKRLNLIKRKLKINYYLNDRLGPVLALPLEKFKNIKYLSKKFLIRHNSKFIDKKIKFEKCLLVPLHFKINEKDFNNYLKLIKKNYL